MHEIVTLQFGQQSNYLATHFWNIQESYFTYGSQEESLVNHDIHFRQGVGADGSDTFTPRTVIYDFKSEFGTLRRVNELYEMFDDGQPQPSLWGGSTATQTQPQIEQTSYQRSLIEGTEPLSLDADSVRYWSDFNRVYYHPKSLVQVYETSVDPQRRSFDEWRAGEDLFATLDSEDDLFDRDLRPFVEECDQMQGLQMLTDLHSGWSGFSARYLDRLRDEIGKTSIWVWALGEGDSQRANRRANKAINEARALYEISNQASVYIPMTGKPVKLPRYVSMNSSLAWHTSALQVSAFESLLLPSRLSHSGALTSASLDTLATCINPTGDRRIAELGMEIIEPEQDSQMGGLGVPTSPSVSEGDCDFFPEWHVASGSRRSRTFAELDTFRGNVVEDEMFSNGHDDESGEERDYRRFQSALPFTKLSSFPHIYTLKNVNAREVSVRARLKTTSRIATSVRALEAMVRMRVSVDEREELSNGLQEIAGAYVVDFESDDEDGWDD